MRLGGQHGLPRWAISKQGHGGAYCYLLAPLPWATLPKQFSALLCKLTVKMESSSRRPIINTTSEPAETTGQGFSARPRARSTVQVWLPGFNGAEPTMQGPKTYKQAAQSHFYLCLFLTPIPFHHGCPEGQSVNNSATERLHQLLWSSQQKAER